MPDQDGRAALDALANATQLYERYAELSKLAEISLSVPEETVIHDYSWDHPLGLTIRTRG